MSLIDFIEKQRAKPEMARRRIAFMSTLAITAVVFLVWLSTFVSSVVATESAGQNSERGPIEELTVTSTSFFSNVMAGVESLKDVFSSKSSVESPIELK